jgi:hypothetical protein
VEDAGGSAVLVRGMASYFVEVAIVCIRDTTIGILAREEDNITDLMHCGLKDVVRCGCYLLYQCRAVGKREGSSEFPPPVRPFSR